MKTSIFILIIILFSQTCNTLFANTINIKAKNGKIDLSLWNNNKNGIIKLDGEWEFYWNRLLFHDDFINSSPVMTGYITVPKKWNNIEFKNVKIKYEGCATYRLLVTGLSKGEIYGVKFRDAGIAYSMFVDGKQVLFNGVVSSSKENEVPQYLGKYGNFIASGDNTEFIFQVSNFHHVKGGFWNTLELGKSESIIEKVQFETGYDMFIIGAIIIIAFYHLGIFVFRRKDKASLYFSFFCFFIALRSMIVSDYKYIFNSLSISWEYIFKVDLIFQSFHFHYFLCFLPLFTIWNTRKIV